MSATSPDAPWSVATVNEKVGGWIAHLGDVWVTGQVVQFRQRPGAWMQYLTLRDLEEKASVTVSIENRVLEASAVKIAEGAQVLVHAKPDYYGGNGA
ncbi:MAG: exodeoxyribonuclease VII large subunit, partial [Cellulomonadaceae bacterium]|nr:exodeoxyribonuclease VII large subunit [Cellulomonadaceae bacterium]